MSKQSGFMNFVAFIAIIFIGVALFISWLPFVNDTSVASALQVIANVLAYITVAFYAFIYAQRKWERKQIWFMIALIASLVLIVLSFI